MTAASPTRTLAARRPDGWWLQHPRYRLYVLFAATGLVLAAVNAVLLFAIAALANGFDAWLAYLEALGSIPGLLLTLLLLLGTFFFSLRWLRVGAKIPAVRLGPLPAPSMTIVAVGHFAGLVTLTALLLIFLSGVVV